MTCYSNDAFADRLDGLLTPDEVNALDAHVSACDACSARFAAAGRAHVLLATPFTVEAPSADLKTRIERAHAHRPSRVGTVLRYAASFAAGVLVTLAVNALTPVLPTHSTEPPPVADDDAPVDDIPVPSVPRRIH